MELLVLTIDKNLSYISGFTCIVARQVLIRTTYTVMQNLGGCWTSSTLDTHLYCKYKVTGRNIDNSPAIPHSSFVFNSRWIEQLWCTDSLSLVAEKRDIAYSTTLHWLRCRLNSSLFWSAIVSYSYVEELTLPFAGKPTFWLNHWPGLLKRLGPKLITYAQEF